MINLNNAAQVAEVAEQINTIVLKRIGGFSDMEGRKGGYYCLADRGLPVVNMLVGIVPEIIRRAKYYRLAQEKVERLFQYHVTDGDMLSRQSANDDEEKYPGAIHGRDFQHGFSGYPADVGEIISALIAIDLGDLTPNEARSLIGGNRYFPQFAYRFVPSDPPKLSAQG